jgi:hypothetical protein
MPQSFYFISACKITKKNAEHKKAEKNHFLEILDIEKQTFHLF